jgi:hypothetical protein
MEIKSTQSQTSQLPTVSKDKFSMDDSPTETEKEGSDSEIHSK